MISAKLPPTDYVAKSVNMFWDGIFHAFTLIVVIIGIVLLYKLQLRNDVARSSKIFTGGLILGWGLFNLVEGIIDHQILKLHNVKEVSATPNAYNIGFLAFSVVLSTTGFALINTSKQKQA